jgi:tetratricopeptide (TPR) repeat protein
VRTVPLGAVVFAAAFALFATCAAPGLYLRDAGELTTAAFTLGVAHPTGFALWALLAKAATLVPIGEVATRVSFFSALGGAAAAWLAYRAVRALAPDDGESATAAAAGVAAAALLCAGVTFFRASTVPEVYAPTAALLAAALLLLARAVDGDRRCGLLLALVGGLSFGMHAHVRLLVGPAAIVVALWRLRRGDRWPLLATTALALGAAVVAYLPLRAARLPAANWSDPETLGGVAAHLSAARIRHAFAGEMFHRVGAHFVAFARLTEAQLGLPALLCALGGVVWLCGDRRRRALGVVVAIVLVGDALYSAALNPMALDDLQDGHPTALCIAIAAGAGVLALARRLGRGAPWAAGAMAVLLCVPAALADVDYKLGLAHEAGSWTRAALAEAPPRARVLVESDDLAAGTTYEQYVAGARPDVLVLVRQHAWDKPEEAARARRADHTVADDRAALLWEPGTDPAPSPITPDVPLYRAYVDGPLPPARPLAERIARLLEPARDPTVRIVECEALVALGRLYLLRGDAARANALFETALAARPGDAAAGVDLAVVHARGGDVKGALALVDAVLARDPDRYVARLNAARYRLVLGDLDGAARDFAAAHELVADAASPLVGLGRVALAKNDRSTAQHWLRAAEKADSSDADVRALHKELER